MSTQHPVLPTGSHPSDLRLWWSATERAVYRTYSDADGVFKAVEMVAQWKLPADAEPLVRVSNPAPPVSPGEAAPTPEHDPTHLMYDADTGICVDCNRLVDPLAASVAAGIGPAKRVFLAAQHDAEHEDLDDVLAAALRAAFSAARKAGSSPVAEPPIEPHRYLSTGCLHHEHDYCASMTGMQGDKRPASCKFCNARCVCLCHGDAAPEVVRKEPTELHRTTFATDPAKRFLSRILDVVNTHEGDDPARAMDEIHAVCMDAAERPASPATEGPAPHEHVWRPCARCPQPDQPCACVGGPCCSAEVAESVAEQAAVPAHPGDPR